MTESPRRRTRRPLWRLVPLLVGLGAAYFLQQMFGSQPTELLAVIPAASDDGSGVTLRVTRASDHKLVVLIRQLGRSGEGHTVVVHTKLPRGRYHVEAWLENAAHAAFEAEFDFKGEDLVEVPLAPRTQGS